MIHPIDFRIGNYVNTSKIITGIFDDFIFLDSQFGRVISINELSPILISKKWLLSFGFIKCEGSFLAEYKFIYKHYNLSISKFPGQQSHYLSSEIVNLQINKSIKYIHELQNIFWTMFDLSLTIVKAPE